MQPHFRRYGNSQSCTLEGGGGIYDHLPLVCREPLGPVAFADQNAIPSAADDKYVTAGEV